MMTYEQISEKIRDHLIEQRRPATTPGGACMYHVNVGGKLLMCAVGCLIPEYLYDRAMEGSTPASGDQGGVKLRIALRELYDSINIQMLKEWQNYHDGSAYGNWCCHQLPQGSPSEFHENMRERYFG